MSSTFGWQKNVVQKNVVQKNVVQVKTVLLVLFYCRYLLREVSSSGYLINWMIKGDLLTPEPYSRTSTLKYEPVTKFSLPSPEGKWFGVADHVLRSSESSLYGKRSHILAAKDLRLDIIDKASHERGWIDPYPVEVALPIHLTEHSALILLERRPTRKCFLLFGF